MARVTIEDCLHQVDNRFDLVLLAAKRARQLLVGKADPLVEWGNHKATVIALREIGTGKISKDTIEALEQPMKMDSTDTE